MEGFPGAESPSGHWFYGLYKHHCLFFLFLIYKEYLIYEDIDLQGITRNNKE